MLTLRSTTKPQSFGVDYEKFKSIMTLTDGEKSTDKKNNDCNGEGDNSSLTSLHLTRLKGSPRLTLEGILVLVDYCRCLRELFLPYTLLNDELLMALSTEKKVQLETLCVEAYSESKPLSRISENAWYNFARHLPNINLILQSYVTEEDDHGSLFASHIPVTHLYFGEPPSKSILSRIGRLCPRLVELVIGTCGPGLIDESLISAARGCPHLSVVGLGDCEITCSGFVEFVSLCSERLTTLYVWETSLIEDSKFDVTKMSAKVSSLLGRTWVPEYIPLW